MRRKPRPQRAEPTPGWDCFTDLEGVLEPFVTSQRADLKSGTAIKKKKTFLRILLLFDHRRRFRDTSFKIKMTSKVNFDQSGAYLKNCRNSSSSGSRKMKTSRHFVSVLFASWSASLRTLRRRRPSASANVSVGHSGIPPLTPPFGCFQGPINSLYNQLSEEFFFFFSFLFFLLLLHISPPTRHHHHLFSGPPPRAASYPQNTLGLF